MCFNRDIYYFNLCIQINYANLNKIYYIYKYKINISNISNEEDCVFYDNMGNSIFHPKSPGAIVHDPS